MSGKEPNDGWKEERRSDGTVIIRVSERLDGPTRWAKHHESRRQKETVKGQGELFARCSIPAT